MLTVVGIKTKVSILTPDLSHNCLGRAHLLAKILKGSHDVEIVGPVFGKEIWAPLGQLNDVAYQCVKIKGRFQAFWQLESLLPRISGDILYASKPLFTSYGIGIIKKASSKKPLILDIDDWELGFAYQSFISSRMLNRLFSIGFSYAFPYDMGSIFNRFIHEKMIPLASDISVSGTFLLQKFGGTLIWHARDTDEFDPGKFDSASFRVKYGIKNSAKVVMFLGTPRPYKGVEDLINAVRKIDDPNVVLIVVGIGFDNYSRQIKDMGQRLLGGRFISVGLQSFERIPEYLSIGDVIVIPQKESIATFGQVPAKIFDAMALAKPIIATRVSDIPNVLKGCGWVIEPGNLKQMSETIQYIFDNPTQSKRVGKLARKECIEKYSIHVMRKKMDALLRKYE